MISPDRLITAMGERRISQARLAQMVGISGSMIGKLVRGEARGSTHILQIAQALRTSPEYLIGEAVGLDANPLKMQSKEDLAEEMGLVKVDEVDLALGMGAAYLDQISVETMERWIPADWVGEFTKGPASSLTIARPRGDSMYPTINDRDIVVIDRSSRMIDQQDNIWALVYGGLGTIKRVRVTADGSFKLMADNPNVREEVAQEGELFVIGRIAGVIRRT